MIQFPDIVDNTIRNDFLRCPTYARHMYVENIVPADFTSQQHAEKVFRDALAVTRREYYDKAMSSRYAVAQGRKYIEERWCDRFNGVAMHALVESFNSYFETWKLNQDSLHPAACGSRQLIGDTVLLQLPLRNPVTDNPILYAIHVGMIGICQETGSAIIVCDGLGWDYTTHANALIAADITEKFYAASILLPGMEFSAEVRTAGDLYGNRRSSVYRPHWMRAAWYRQVSRDIERMLVMYKQGRFDSALNDACIGCGYKSFCLAEKPSDVHAKFINAQWCAKTGERVIL